MARSSRWSDMWASKRKR